MIKKTHLKIPYGRGFLGFSLPSNRFLGLLKPEGAKKRRIADLFREAIKKPIGGEALEDIVKNGQNALVVIPDSTRKAHLKEILPLVLKKIEAEGREIDIIIATGLHKKHDNDQVLELLGRQIVRKHKILSHGPKGDALIRFGFGMFGTPVVLNRNLARYDVIISLGVIEPHLYAGYSGGAKTIAIGLAGEETINATHSVKFLDNPLTRIGSIENNPFQDFLREAIKNVPLRFVVNVVNDAEGEPIKIFAGPLEEVFKNGVSFAKKVFEVKAEKAADIVICGIGYPKDVNLYQASRALNYVVNVDRPVLRKGGVLIVAAELEKGFGDSPAEARFYGELKSMRSAKKFIANIKREGCVAGEHRAYMIARALADYKIVFVTKKNKVIMRDLPFPSFDNIPNALAYAEGTIGKKSTIYVIPRSLATIATRG